METLRALATSFLRFQSAGELYNRLPRRVKERRLRDARHALIRITRTADQSSDRGINERHTDGEARDGEGFEMARGASYQNFIVRLMRC